MIRTNIRIYSYQKNNTNEYLNIFASKKWYEYDTNEYSYRKIFEYIRISEYSPHPGLFSGIFRFGDRKCRFWDIAIRAFLRIVVGWFSIDDLLSLRGVRMDYKLIHSKIYQIDIYNEPWVEWINIWSQSNDLIMTI